MGSADVEIDVPRLRPVRCPGGAEDDRQEEEQHQRRERELEQQPAKEPTFAEEQVRHAIRHDQQDQIVGVEEAAQRDEGAGLEPAALGEERHRSEEREAAEGGRLEDDVEDVAGARRAGAGDEGYREQEEKRGEGAATIGDDADERVNAHHPGGDGEVLGDRHRPAAPVDGDQHRGDVFERHVVMRRLRRQPILIEDGRVEQAQGAQHVDDLVVEAVAVPVARAEAE